jgi:hypothetical protein
LDGRSTGRKAATYTPNNTNQNKRTQTSMPLVGFEPTIPVFERAKTVHALDRATTVIGVVCKYKNKNNEERLLYLCSRGKFLEQYHLW